ncbi:hypothetical protein Tco_1336944 [Tanacetum coccineum]
MTITLLKTKANNRDEDQDPPTGSDKEKKRSRKGKDFEPPKKSSKSKESSKGKTQSKPSSTDKPVNAEDPLHEAEMDMEEPIIYDVVNEADQPQDDVAPTQGNPIWFKQPPRPHTPDLEWNKDNILMMDRSRLDKITKPDLVGLVYKLLKGTCKSNIKLDYNMDQYYNALTDQLDWTNPEGDRCPYDLSKPLPLQGSPGNLTILVDFFFNNDLGYLKTRNSERKYTTSITKTKAAKYKLKFIEEMILKLWSPVKVAYDKDIFSVVSVKVDKQFGYGYLKEIVVRRADRKLYTFKEEDDDDIVDLAVALRMFTQRIVIQNRVEDVQLGVESYQKKLNITKPQEDFPGIPAKDPYTTSYDPKGVFYLNSSKRKRMMRADELYKFSNRTLQSVCKTLHYRLLNFKLGYKKDMPSRKWTNKDQNRTYIMVQLIDKQLLERRIMRILE